MGDAQAKSVHEKINEILCDTSFKYDQSACLCDLLNSFRYLSYELIQNPQMLLEDLIQNKIESNKGYYPLDVVELRLALSQDRIPSIKPMLFSYKFTQKYLQDYPLLLCIDISKDDYSCFGGLAIGEYYSSLHNSLKRIYISSKLSKKTIEDVQNILKEEDIKCDMIVDTKVPGLSNPKLAAALNAYIVNISQLGIEDETIHADTEEEAVADAINRKWDRVQQAKNLRYREHKYRPQTWLKLRNTEFWSNMVRHAHTVKSIKMAQLNDNIQLSEIEQKIFNFIKMVIADLKQKGMDAECRVAGGWVRDKLMGYESDDIDIATNISGIQLANYMSKYARDHNIDGVGNAHEVSLEKLVDKDGDEGEETLKVGGINIFGQKIEFVPMRKEIYDSESRKPTIVLTNNVEDDVLRRDLTINSLYYNILTGKVEDYVGGKEDLEKMVLRTPAGALEGYDGTLKTYIEDPLRMLRVLRFYTRYPNAKIDSNIIKVMEQSKDPNSEFSKAYKAKVAPSRSSKELRKMMQSKDPIPASRLLLDSNFYKLVFNVSPEWYNMDMDQQSPFHNLTLKGHTLRVMEELKNIANEIGLEDNSDERGLVLLAGLLHDFGKMSPDIRAPKIDKKTGKPVTFQRGEETVERMRYIRHEVESATFLSQTLKDMNFNEEERDFVELIVRGHMTPTNLKKFVEMYEEKSKSGNSRKAKDTMNRHLGQFLQSVDQRLDTLMMAIENVKKDTRISDEDKANRIKDLEKWITPYGRLWQWIMYHHRADSMGKSDMTEREIEETKAINQKLINVVKNYRDTLGTLTRTPVGDKFGNVIREMMQELVPDLPRDAMLSDSRIKRPTHYIKFIMMKVIEQQQLGYIKTLDDAKEFIRKSGRNWGNIWKQQIRRQQMSEYHETNLANNWYKMQKKADASSASEPSGFDGYEGQSPLERVDMPYTMEDRSSPLPFQVGDKVRVRQVGMIYEQIEGRVVDAQENLIVIDWQTGRYAGKTEKMTMDKATIKLDVIK
jgi:tRNA nucleotidyltransferase/poly(A) polymerase